MSRPQHPYYGDGDLRGPQDRVEPPGVPTHQWYSDEALRKQTALDAMPPGADISLELFAGIYEPRTRPTPDERCSNCGLDARHLAGGERIDGKRWCEICFARGRHVP